MSYATTNPYTGKQLKTFPEATDAEIEQTLKEGHEAFLKWKKTSFAERAGIFRKAGKLLRDNADQYARLMTKEMGKLLAEGKGEIELCADICDYYAENTEELLKPQKIKPLIKEEGESCVYPAPQGIIFAVEPWNFPFYQIFRIIVPQVSAGNTVILKHAGNVPECAAASVEIMLQAGLPKGVFQNVYSARHQTEIIINDPRVRGVALTGSAKAGGHIAALASKAIKKSTLELGGSDVLTVLEDADLEKAVKWAVIGRHSNAGQICIAAKRIIVMDKIYDRFLELYRKGVAELKAGDPLDPKTTLAPLCSANAVKTLKLQVEEAKKQGVKVEVIGAPVPKEGSFFQPVLLTNLEKTEIRHQEFFGPVTQLYRVKTEQEAIDLANDSDFGLAGSIYTKDEKRGVELAKQIDSGGIFINHAPFSRPNFPFGGVKHSGYGRELADAGLLEFINFKLVNVSDIDGPALM